MDHRGGEGFNFRPLETPREVEVEFWAQSGLDAIGRLHYTVQREARGKANPAKPREARHRYGPAEYVLKSLSGLGTGAYDLPRGPTPDMSVEGRARELERITPPTWFDEPQLNLR